MGIDVTKCLFLSTFLFTAGGAFLSYSKYAAIFCCGLALLLFFIPFLCLPSHYKKPSNSVYFNTVFGIFLFWEVYIVMYPLFFDGVILKDGYSMLYDYTLPAYFVPLLLLLGHRHLQFEKLIEVLPLFMFLALIFAFLNRQVWQQDYQSLEYVEYQESLQLSSGVIGLLNVSVLMIPFLNFVESRWTQILIILASGLVIAFCLVAARRGSLATNALYVLVFIYFRFLYGKGQIMKWLILPFIVCSLTMVVIYISKLDMASYLIERGMEDSRSGVELFFYKDFTASPVDWLLGRGINGYYFCPFFDNPRRQVIETGFLFLILKGGLIYLFLYVSLFVHAIWRGFRSSNVILKIMASELVIRLLTLYPFGLPAFSSTDLFCWFYIFYCERYGGKNRFRTSKCPKLLSA